MLKNRYNEGKKSNLYFWRDNHGHEIDCLIENRELFKALEIKSSQTTNTAFFDGLRYWKDLSTDSTESIDIVFGGNSSIQASKGNYISWRDLERLSS